MTAAHVRLENPDTGGVWDAPADYVPVALARGWVESDKPLPEEVEDTTKDPEVLATHLAESDDVEIDRVLDAERDGKARKTITGEEPTQPKGVSLNG